MDISQKIEAQKEQVEYWRNYLRTHLPDSDEFSIIIVGNRLDEVNDRNLKNETISYFTSLKDKLIFDFVLLSAQQVTRVDELVSIFQKKCQSLLLDKDKFMIPKLYKMTAELLQSEDVSFLIGKLKFLTFFKYDCRCN